MENIKGRVLGYTMATVLDKEALEGISGGASQMTSRQTIRITGAGGADVAYDVAIDW